MTSRLVNYLFKSPGNLATTLCRVALSCPRDRVNVSPLNRLYRTFSATRDGTLKVLLREIPRGSVSGICIELFIITEAKRDERIAFNAQPLSCGMYGHCRRSDSC